MILAIETSCDDTCAAVVSDRGSVMSNIISSQLGHEDYGGVVPELAARQHMELIATVVDLALARAGVRPAELEAIAVTSGPGLAGALLVGVGYGKGLAEALSIPLRAVDHIDGHVAASMLAPEPPDGPFLALIASGGHTMLCRVDGAGPGWTQLGSTLDDAAGEAFDKGARLLGLGYPGGPAIDRLASDGDPGAFEFPTASGVDGLDFSFSGVKTSLLYTVRELGEEASKSRSADLAASFQRAIVSQLLDRIERGLERTGFERLAIGGGVAANSLLRSEVGSLGIPVAVPAMEFCTDNAAMIGRAALALPDLSADRMRQLDVTPTVHRGGQHN